MFYDHFVILFQFETSEYKKVNLNFHWTLIKIWVLLETLEVKVYSGPKEPRKVHLVQLESCIVLLDFRLLIERKDRE